MGLSDILGGHKMILPCLPLSPNAKLPTQENEDDFGWDLYPCETVVVGCDVVAVKTGLAMAIPRGYGGMVKERSGLARKYGVKLEGLRFEIAPSEVDEWSSYTDVSGGVIDAGYRGELIVLLSIRSGYPPRTFTTSDKVAQLLILARPTIKPVWFSELPPSIRGERGFGDSGGTGSPVPKGPTDPLPSLDAHAISSVPPVQDEYWPEKGPRVLSDASPDPATYDLPSVSPDALGEGSGGCGEWSEPRGINGVPPSVKGRCSCFPVYTTPGQIWGPSPIKDAFNSWLAFRARSGSPLSNREANRLKDAASGYPEGSIAERMAMEEAAQDLSYDRKVNLCDPEPIDLEPLFERINQERIALVQKVRDAYPPGYVDAQGGVRLRVDSVEYDPDGTLEDRDEGTGSGSVNPHIPGDHLADIRAAAFEGDSHKIMLRLKAWVGDREPGTNFQP